MLAVVLVGTFMAVLDVAIVNVAIPSIRADLDAGFGAVELVVSAYTIAYACLLVTGGRLGDIYGRKQLFVLGIAVFTVASAVCGAAPSIDVLIAARVLQGVGGALLYPQVLSTIQVTFDGPERTKALGLFGSVIGIAAIAGPLVGGLLLRADVAGLTWRPVFLVNVPVGILAAVAAVVVLPAETHERRSSLDLGGVGLAAVSVILLVVPLLLGRDLGWPLWLVVCLPLAVPAGIAFVRYERRLAARGGSPLLQPALFRQRGFATGVPIAALFIAASAGFLITFALYLQVGLGFSPLESGLIYTPTAVGFFAASLLAPRLVPVLGRSVLSVGYAVDALGLLATAGTAWAAGSHVTGWELAPPLFIAGFGQGLGMSPLVGTIIAGLKPEEAGAGAGVVTTTLQVGNALGVAVLSLIFFTLIGSEHGAVHYANAFSLTLPIAAALLLAAAVLVHRLPRSPLEAANALIERLPDWASGFAYSMFLMTGGRVADEVFEEILGHVAQRRLRRTQEAPEALPDFLTYHFDQAGGDRAWLNYLQREALTSTDGTIAHEDERLPVIRAQVEEVIRRQEAGEIPAEFDPAIFRLFVFALSNYPRLLPQITRMTTGHDPDDPEFVAAWEAFLRRLGELLTGTQTEATTASTSSP